MSGNSSPEPDVEPAAVEPAAVEPAASQHLAAVRLELGTLSEHPAIHHGVWAIQVVDWLLRADPRYIQVATILMENPPPPLREMNQAAILRVLQAVANAQQDLQPRQNEGQAGP